MNNDLREQVEACAEGVNADETYIRLTPDQLTKAITLIHTATLDEVREAVRGETYDGGSGGMIKVRDALKAIDNLRGKK